MSTASMLMVDPIHSKAYSKRFGDEIRHKDVTDFRKENLGVISMLEELAAKQAEVVQKPPFDDFENNLALKLIDQRLTELYGLVLSNPEQVKDYVEEAIEPVMDRIQEINDKGLSFKTLSTPTYHIFLKIPFENG